MLELHKLSLHLCSFFKLYGSHLQLPCELFRLLLRLCLLKLLVPGSGVAFLYFLHELVDMFLAILVILLVVRELLLAALYLVHVEADDCLVLLGDIPMPLQLELRLGVISLCGLEGLAQPGYLSVLVGDHVLEML